MLSVLAMYLKLKCDPYSIYLFVRIEIDANDYRRYSHTVSKSGIVIGKLSLLPG
jgi:hypothetical protein